MLAIVALIVTGIALLFDIIGLALTYWEKVDGVDVHWGLWKYCGGSTCLDVDDLGLGATDSLKAVRAMVLLGMLLLIGAILCALLKLAVMKDQRRLPQIAGLLAIIAGVFIIVGCIIYAADVKASGSVTDLHAGFALCIISGVAAIVGGVLFLVAKDPQ